VLHGFSSNQFLEEDGGIVLPTELTLRGVISVVQAQRLASLELLNNRQQGSGVFPMSLTAWQMQPLDVMEFTFPTMGWSNKYLEVEKIQLVAEPSKSASGEDDAISLSCLVSVVETDPSEYEWSETEELTPEDVPAIANQIPNTPAAPTEMTVTSSAGTAIIQPGGAVTPRALVSWNAPLDISVTEVQIQYQLVGASTWLSSGTVDVGLFEAFVTGVIAGSYYNFQIRSLRPSGTYSPWVQVLNAMISVTLPVTVTTGGPVAPPGTLIAIALSTGTANIIVQPFECTIGGLSVSVLPAGNYTITGLLQDADYYVYYIDPDFLGGAITPIATTNMSDFFGHIGYFLIGSIVTPTYLVSYYPSTYATSGTATVTNPANAYDGNMFDCASLPAIWGTTLVSSPPPVFSYYAEGCSCIWSGFPSFVTTAAMNLYVTVSTTIGGTIISASCSAAASIAGTPSTLATITATESQTTYSLAVPIGTNLNTITVTGTSSITAGTSPGGGSGVMSVWEIYAQ